MPRWLAPKHNPDPWWNGDGLFVLFSEDDFRTVWYWVVKGDGTVKTQAANTKIYTPEIIRRSLDEGMWEEVDQNPLGGTVEVEG